MGENSLIQYQFSVRVKDVVVHSAMEVTDRGMHPTSIIFHLEPLGSVGTPCDLRRNLFGEDLNRALRLQKSGSTIVEVRYDWWKQHCMTWREKVIDLALQKFPSTITTEI
jgi:hypothetical protein